MNDSQTQIDPLSVSSSLSVPSQRTYERWVQSEKPWDEHLVPREVLGKAISTARTRCSGDATYLEHVLTSSSHYLVAEERKTGRWRVAALVLLLVALVGGPLLALADDTKEAKAHASKEANKYIDDLVARHTVDYLDWQDRVALLQARALVGLAPPTASEFGGPPELDALHRVSALSPEERAPVVRAALASFPTRTSAEVESAKVKSAFFLDDERFLTVSGRGVQRWSTADQDQRHRGETLYDSDDDIRRSKYHPPSKQLALGIGSSRVVLLDLSQDPPVDAELEGLGQGEVRDFCFSVDGAQLVVVGPKGLVASHSRENGVWKRDEPVESKDQDFSQVLMTPDAAPEMRHFVIVAADKLWVGRPGERLDDLADGAFTATAVSPEGQWLVAGARGGDLHFFQREGGGDWKKRRRAQRSVTDAVESMVFLSEEQLVVRVGEGLYLVESSGDGWSEPVRCQRATSAATPSHAPALRGLVAGPPDSGEFLTYDAAGAVTRWRDGWQLPGHPARHAAKVLHAAFSADGSRVLSTGGDGYVRLWRTQVSEEEVERFSDQLELLLP